MKRISSLTCRLATAAAGPIAVIACMLALGSAAKLNAQDGPTTIGIFEFKTIVVCNGDPEVDIIHAIKKVVAKHPTLQVSYSWYDNDGVGNVLTKKQKHALDNVWGGDVAQPVPDKTHVFKTLITLNLDGAVMAFMKCPHSAFQPDTDFPFTIYLVDGQFGEIYQAEGTYLEVEAPVDKVFSEFLGQRRQ